MPNSPYSQADICEILASWQRGDVPSGGVVMAVLRMAYSGSSQKETIFVGLMCGALALSTYSALDYFDVQKVPTIDIGGFFGFVGVNKLSSFLSGYVGNRWVEAIRMQTSKNDHDFINGFESLRLIAYPATGTGDKPWTIGWGHTKGVKPSDRITP